MNSDTSKQYYISAAPQCPRPDQSLSDDILVKTDMVWVQFYNNQEAGCCNGQSGFISSLQAWSKAVEPAQIWIGAPGVASAVDDGGYISASKMQSQIAQVKQLGLPNFGGVALWDAEVSVQNGNYQNAVASALAGSSSKSKKSSSWAFGKSKAKKARHVQA
jgi:chitinase